jgi:hypothetical protein
MPPISHQAQFIRELRAAKLLSFEALATALGLGWTADKVRSKALEFDRDESSPIWVVRGGVQFVGDERVADPVLYEVVRRGINRSWALRRRMGSTIAVHTSRSSQRAAGTWTQPDLVARRTRLSGAVQTEDYLAIEVEQARGFSIVSVYQAYEVGRGADYSWVFYEGAERTGPEWNRITTAAADLGVGIVHLGKPTHFSKWNTKVAARRRDTTPTARQAFLSRCLVTPDLFDPAGATEVYSSIIT